VYFIKLIILLPIQLSLTCPISFFPFFSSNDYREFIEDLEEDPEMRQKINIFKDAKKQNMAVDVNDMADPSMPQVTLEEMLDDLVLDDVEMADA
jgi:hypothetical protein